MKVNNVVFDIGNVLVRWVPQDVIRTFFQGEETLPELNLKIFKSPLWYDLNLGKLTEKEAIKLYSQQLHIPEDKLEDLMDAIKESLVPLNGSFELLDELYGRGVPLYSITDNVHEIMTYLRKRYDFLRKFSGIVVSADLGVLKPSPLIYQHLINVYNLIPEQTVFIDDLLKNVEGARHLGLHGIQFTDAAQCREELTRLGVLGG